MALVQVNAGAGGLRDTKALDAALDRVPSNHTVTIMTHGLRFSPDHPGHTPHDHILSLRPRRCWKAVSWPRHLHLDRADAGLGIAFGWPALGPVPRVARSAFDAGGAMADLIARIAETRPDVSINLMAHSLGTRVVLAATRAAPRNAVARIVLMSGAEYRGAARAALAAPGGQRAQVLNVCSTENTVFDALFHVAAPAPRVGDRTVSAGLPDTHGWLDLRVDCRRTRAALADLGFRIGAPVTPVCHWSTYLRPGLFPLYRRVFAPGPSNMLTALRAHLDDPTPEPSALHDMFRRRRGGWSVPRA